MADPAEEAVIGGAVTIDGPWSTAMLELEPEDFLSHDLAKIWDGIREVRRRGEPCDIIHVYGELKREHGVEVAVRMTELAESCPTCANLDHWARLVIDGSRQRGAVRAAQDALQRSQGSGNADDTIAAIQDAMRQVRPALTNTGPKLARVMLGDVLNELEAERKDPNHSRLCATGIPSLDESLELRAGHLTILAARPGMGKSALAGNIATYVAQGDGCVVTFSLEMDAASLIRRALQAEARTKGPLTHAIGSVGLMNAFNRVEQMRLYIDDRSGLSVEQMTAAAAKIPGVRLVVVDYLQLARMQDKLERQDLRVGRVTKELKAMAKTLGAHVIALSQLSRAVEQRSPPIPILADLRDSGQIEEDADNVVFIYRPGYYDQEADQEEAQIIIAKQRHGRIWTIKTRWLGAAQRFVQW